MQNTNNKKVVYIAVGIIVLALAFYAGMMVGKGQAGTSGPTFTQNGTRTGNFSGGNFAGRFAGSGSGTFVSRGAGGMDAGTIIAKDAESITIKTRDGGSKIIFYNGSTQVMKTAAAAASDLSVGEEVNVLGSTNSDGSVSANSIQIRPAVPPGNPQGQQ